MTALNTDIDTLIAADADACSVAATAAQEYLDKHYGGQDAGCCGFAWVTYWPAHKGNTKAGKAERRMMERIGFSQDYNNSWRKSNPARAYCQNIDAKYAGAQAYAEKLLAMTGVKVSAQERVD